MKINLVLEEKEVVIKNIYKEEKLAINTDENKKYILENIYKCMAIF